MNFFSSIVDYIKEKLRLVGSGVSINAMGITCDEDNNGHLLLLPLKRLNLKNLQKGPKGCIFRFHCRVSS